MGRGFEPHGAHNYSSSAIPTLDWDRASRHLAKTAA